MPGLLQSSGPRINQYLVFPNTSLFIYMHLQSSTYVQLYKFRINIIFRIHFCRQISTPTCVLFILFSSPFSSNAYFELMAFSSFSNYLKLFLVSLLCSFNDTTKSKNKKQVEWRAPCDILCNKMLNGLKTCKNYVQQPKKIPKRGAMQRLCLEPPQGFQMQGSISHMKLKLPMKMKPDIGRQTIRISCAVSAYNERKFDLIGTRLAFVLRSVRLVDQHGLTILWIYSL